MSCFHPLKGFKIGVNPSGKPNYKITSYDTEYVIRDHDDRWISVKSPLPSDLLLPRVTESIDIPCGHCIGCYLDRSRQWADRCMLEAEGHLQNCFITLTYDDEHINKLYHLDDCYKVRSDNFYSLDKRDFQLFMKNLRYQLDAKFGKKIRFFACGEYGSKTMRPHFHAIIFGHDFSDDRILYKRNFNGDYLYNSPLLSSVWNYGYSVIAECNWETCAYVARYCLKKRDNDITAQLNALGLDPEFVTMSRRPGIARNYYDDNFRDIYNTERIMLPKGKVIRPPKYFDKLYDIDYPSDMERIKNNRAEFAKLHKAMILDKTDLDYMDYLAVKEYNTLKRTEILKERRVESNETFK